ncbi:MAG: FtsX-like permease family protein, partial [Candidatus Shapirobacteria bacterium]|nr:FtsX-like permease family protein [Candidatus Shapirobacteria bacterium]
VIRGLLKYFTRMKLLGKLFLLIKTEVLINLLTKLMYKIDVNEDGGVTKSYLIELAFRNMKAKRNRAIVTVGGVALGVGAIVFLVSIGYGLEQLVISRVAKLDELKIADVSLGKALTVKLNDETIEKIKSFKDVDQVIPVVSMVSKINYNNSVFDVMSFGVDERYIKMTNPVFVAGEKFTDKDRNFVYSNESNSSVLGVTQEIETVDDSMKTKNGIFDFNIEENKKVMVTENCESESEAFGYVIRSEGGYVGEEMWGEFYLDKTTNLIGKKEKSNEEYSKWIRGKVPLWMVDEKGTAVPKLTKDGQQEWTIGCFKKENVVIEKNKDGIYNQKTLDQYLQGDVLGEATASATLTATEEATVSADLFETVTATDSAGVEWVELKKVEEDPNKLKEVPFMGSPVSEAFVSTGMLKLLGLTADKAIGTNFKISYIIPDGNISGVSGRLQSAEVEYKIKGVVEDPNSNYYYFQIADAKRLGISVYSQLKVVAKDKTVLGDVRKSIEGLGLKTDSTADTVVRIESLFGTLRIILGFLGTIALAVASLGMFNTMTVSLLERTREVGVMKTMGMLSNEVRELFLAESMIMGVGGGVLGIVFGFLLGRVLSLILSSISFLKGQGTINIAMIPWFFTVFILVVSFLVGIITGWYPSKRARQISALNALRYE